MFVQPQCLSAQEEADLTVFSLNLARQHQSLSTEGEGPHPPANPNSSPTGRVFSVLLVKDDTVLVHSVCDAVKAAQGLLRFTVPADLLAPSVVTAHLAACDQHGGVVKVVDSGKLLVLEAVAAAEVQSLFLMTTRQVQQLVCSISTTAPAAADASASAASGMQHRRTLFDLLTRSGVKSRPGGVGANGAGSSSASQQPQQGIKPPDAATLYAYEHFFVPLLRQWEVALTHKDADASSSTGGPVVLEPADDILQLFSLLLEQELWACCLELLGRYPLLAAQARRPGQRQEDGAREDAPDPRLSSYLRGLQPAPASTRSTGAPSSAQQPREGPQPRPALAVDRQQQHQQQLLLEQQQQQEYEMLCEQQQQMLLQQQQQHNHHQQQQMLLQQEQLHQMLSYQQSQQHEQAVWLHQRQQQHQHMLQQLAAPVQMHHQQASALLQQHMLLQQQLQHPPQQLGFVPPRMLGSVSPSPMQAAAAQPQALPPHAGTLSPTGSDETVESASEILVRLGLLQQARGEQEALQQLAMAELHQHQQEQQEPQEQQHDTQQPSAYSLSAFSAAWSVPLPVVQPPLRLCPSMQQTAHPCVPYLPR